MNSHLCRAALLMLLALGVPASAFAQLDKPSWGISVGFSPFWKVPEGLGKVFEAERLDLKGQEFRIGAIRGTTRGGEWGISLVHKRISKKSVIAVRQGADVVTVTADDAEFLGVSLDQFVPFYRTKHVHIGADVSGGLAQMRGFLTATVDQKNTATVHAKIPFRELFRLGGRDVKIFPLARAQIAASVLAGDRVKVRIGGGLNMPAIEYVTITVSTLFGRE
jgi:hypothetical protein